MPTVDKPALSTTVAQRGKRARASVVGVRFNNGPGTPVELQSVDNAASQAMMWGSFISPSNLPGLHRSRPTRSNRATPAPSRSYAAPPRRQRGSATRQPLSGRHRSARDRTGLQLGCAASSPSEVAAARCPPVRCGYWGASYTRPWAKPCNSCSMCIAQPFNVGFMRA